eukprot:TRINITY_DN3500_c1_g1_i2.p1 TRINITY_DN3500_c1_g1~~TRINITY_DN3500_c1_g1_i2.p1  ORF type:complete len:805 (+),score=152.33 TRINITY_DN3500_c1_g1_i2:1286-3700(+)
MNVVRSQLIIFVTKQDPIQSMEQQPVSTKDVLESAILDTISSNGGSLPMSCFFMHRPELKKLLGDKKLKDFIQNECTKVVIFEEEERQAKVFGGQTAKSVLKARNSEDLRTDVAMTPVGRRAVNVLEKVVAAQLERSSSSNSDRKLSVAYLSRNFKIRKKLKSAFALAPHPHLVNHPSLRANTTSTECDSEKDQMTTLFNLYLLSVLLDNSDRFRLSKGPKDDRCEPPVHINDEVISKGMGCPCEIFVELIVETDREQTKREEYIKNLVERLVSLVRTANPHKGVSIAWLGQDLQVQKRLQGRGLLDTLLANPSDKLELMEREGKYHVRVPLTLYGRVLKIYQYRATNTLKVTELLSDPLIANLSVENLLSDNTSFQTFRKFVEVQPEEQEDTNSEMKKRRKLEEEPEPQPEPEPTKITSDTKRRKTDDNASNADSDGEKKKTRTREVLIVELSPNVVKEEVTTKLDKLILKQCERGTCTATDLLKDDEIRQILTTQLVEQMITESQQDKKRTITASDTQPTTLTLTMTVAQGTGESQSAATAATVPINFIGTASGLRAVSKPANITTEALLNIIENQNRESTDQIISISRLDRNTSGVVPYSTSLESEEYMKGQYSSQSVHKKYVALCAGYPPLTGRVENVIALNERAGQNRVRVCKNGKTAITEWQVVKRFRRPTLNNVNRAFIKCLLLKHDIYALLPNLLCWMIPPPSSSERYSLLDVFPHTGRTHQIRFQMAHKGHSLCADAKYGKSKVVQKQTPWCPRHFLHCERVSGVDMEGNSFTFESELAPDLQKVIKTQLVEYFI